MITEIKDQRVHGTLPIKCPIKVYVPGHLLVYHTVMCVYRSMQCYHNNPLYSALCQFTALDCLLPRPIKDHCIIRNTN